MGLAGLHLFLFRSAGPAGPFRGTPEELKAKTDYFFPRQIWKDIVGMAAVFACICALAFWEPVVLLEEATPDPGDYHPEPEWYFLFLFQLLRLKIFPASLDSFSVRSHCPAPLWPCWLRCPSSTATPSGIFSSAPSPLSDGWWSWLRF